MCDFCYKHEEAGPHSFRNYSKEHFGQHFDKLVPNTGADGHVHDFNMHYFDIRFSVISVTSSVVHVVVSLVLSGEQKCERTMILNTLS